MGRIRAKWIKNLSEDLFKKYPERFSKDFENNKRVLGELKIVNIKTMRNKLAGYIVRTVMKKRL